MLADQTSVVQLRLRRGQQQARNSAVREMIVDESDNLDAKRAELAQRRAALKARQQAMHASTSLFDAAEASSQQLRDEVRALTTTKVDTALQLHNQQASLLRDLETIFPIELSDASSLLFSICGLPLPNAVSSLPAHELLHEEKRWKATIQTSPLPVPTRLPPFRRRHYQQCSRPRRSTRRAAQHVPRHAGALPARHGGQPSGGSGRDFAHERSSRLPAVRQGGWRGIDMSTRRFC